MAIDPAVWRQIVGDVPLPSTGAVIHYRINGSDPSLWAYGRVNYVWLAEDEPAITLTSGVTLFPTLGDEWRADEARGR